MLEAGDKTESLAAALVPRFLVARFGVKDEATAYWNTQGGNKVERPLKYPHTKMWGLMVARRMRLRVSSVWGRSLYHTLLGKVGSTPDKMAKHVL